MAKRAYKCLKNPSVSYYKDFCKESYKFRAECRDCPRSIKLRKI